MNEAGLACADVRFVRRDGEGGERLVLAGASASFAPGRVALISGPTGSGKSTLLHVLAGLIRPAAGEVRAGGEPVSRWIAAHRDRWRRKVGILFQALHLLPDLTVLENVVAPLAPHARSLSEMRRAGRRALEEIDAAHLIAREVSGLSGGERQRVCLARALVAQPAFLLADEPTAHQDEEGVARVVACLGSARSRGAVVVVSSHDPRLVESGLADDAWCLRDGTLEQA